MHRRWPLTRKVGHVMVFLLLAVKVGAATDHSREHAPYKTGVIEKKAQVTTGQDSPNALGQRRDLHGWIWTVSVDDTLYVVLPTNRDLDLRTEGQLAKPFLAVHASQVDRAWIHIDGKSSEVTLEIVGTSRKAPAT